MINVIENILDQGKILPSMTNEMMVFLLCCSKTVKPVANYQIDVRNILKDIYDPALR